jgi:uncharacterized protein YcfJ
MKARLIVAALATVSMGVAATGAAAAITDTAEVIASVPVYERVSSPRKQCFDESVPVTRPVRHVRSYEQRETRDDSNSLGAGAVVGAVLGGAIGRQFGNSTGGRDRGTVVGAVIGGLVGNQVERDSRAETVAYSEVPVREVEYRTVSRCETVSDYRDEIRGYDVTYRYQGRDFKTRLPYDPGRSLAVRVDVTPDRSAGQVSRAGPTSPQYSRPGYDGQRWN